MRATAWDELPDVWDIVERLDHKRRAALFARECARQRAEQEQAEKAARLALTAQADARRRAIAQGLEADPLDALAEAIRAAGRYAVEYEVNYWQALTKAARDRERKRKAAQAARESQKKREAQAAAKAKTEKARAAARAQARKAREQERNQRRTIRGKIDARRRLKTGKQSTPARGRG